MDVLIPEADLESLLKVKGLSREDQALAYFEFFEDRAQHGVKAAPQFAQTARFYNRYYWFCVFAARRQAASGFDVGLEQQKHQLLESAPQDVDWDLVEKIDGLAGAA